MSDSDNRSDNHKASDGDRKESGQKSEGQRQKSENGGRNRNPKKDNGGQNDAQQPNDKSSMKTGRASEQNGEPKTDGKRSKQRGSKKKVQDIEMTRVDVKPRPTSALDEEDPERNLPTHNNPCCRGCTPKHSFPCRILYFLIIMGLDVADLASDWLLYIDVSLAEEGLVYGPPAKSATIALLVFSIIGSLTFIFEATNLWWEVFRNNPWLDTDLVAAITIWIEDLPQIAINVVIALCREDPISVFQLSKASTVLIALLVRIVMSSVKYCNKAALREAQEQTTESKRHVAYRVFIMLGLLINSACAITVFIFTQTQRDLNGNIIFQVPDTIFEDKYNDQRYFQNVSVFIHHPDFDAPSGPAHVNNTYQGNWVRFMSINDIRDQEGLDISYNYAYEKTSAELKMALWRKVDRTGKDKKGKWNISECYSMTLADGNISAVDLATCQNSSFFTNPINVFITFAFIPPDHIFRKLIFGDIRFNIKVKNNSTCLEYDNFTDSINKNAHIPTIHYYRTSAARSSTSNHLLVQGTNIRFYRNDGTELQDITRVWQTGWGRCESSGSKAPHLQRSIETECDNIATQN